MTTAILIPLLLSVLFAFGALLFYWMDWYFHPKQTTKDTRVDKIKAAVTERFGDLESPPPGITVSDVRHWLDAYCPNQYLQMTAISELKRESEGVRPLRLIVRENTADVRAGKMTRAAWWKELATFVSLSLALHFFETIADATNPRKAKR
jgi:hypothetical protein